MKTAQEWEQEFDILYNSINSNVAPALDSYEKSVLLTMAQEQVVKALYTGSTDGGFEASEANRRHLDTLVKEATLKSKQNGKFGLIYSIDPEVLYIVYEAITCDSCCNKLGQIVVPTPHDEFYKTYHNPFKGPNSTRALRLDVGPDTVEIVGGTGDYFIRYLRKPYPIILEDLSGTTDYINGKQTPHSNVCELDEALHREILTTAISLAQSIYLANSKE